MRKSTIILAPLLAVAAVAQEPGPDTIGYLIIHAPTRGRIAGIE